MDLLCDYTDSSSSSDEEEEVKEEVKKPKVWLPPPDLATASMKADDEKNVIYRSKDSVFRSQYEREQEEAQRVLEQHVAMSDNQARLFEREKDGKKICWNFRKGRCYKGHNCPLFHDGDLKKVKADESSRTQIRLANRGPSDRDLAQMEAHDREQQGLVLVTLKLYLYFIIRRR